MKYLIVILLLNSSLALAQSDTKPKPDPAEVVKQEQIKKKLPDPAAIKADYCKTYPNAQTCKEEKK